MTEEKTTTTLIIQIMPKHLKAKLIAKIAQENVESGKKQTIQGKIIELITRYVYG